MNKRRILSGPPGKTTQPGTTNPEVGIDILPEYDVSTLEDSHVYVHCAFNNTHQGMLIRIWRTTYLIDKGSGSKSELLHIENISYAPQWTRVPDNQLFHFLLIFSALPKSCTMFDLEEEIPQAGGFNVKDIMRNKKDVYHVFI